MLLALMATGVSASQPPTLTVAMKYGNTPLGGISVAVCRVADAKENSYVAVQAFAGAGANFSNLTKEKNIALAASLNAYAAANSIPRSVKVTDSGGKAVYAGLAPGLYLVAQVNGESSEYIIAPYLVAVREDVTASPKTEPIRRSTEKIQISAFKIWKDTENHPNSVQVQLYRNGQTHGAPVTLNAGNYWRCVWDNLNPADTWTVDEPVVPVNYAKSISGSAATGFIVTNTRLSLPNTFDEPVPPGTPGTPGTPNVPKTEDTSNMLLWISLIAGSIVGLIVVFCVWKIKRDSRVVAHRRAGCT